MAQRIPTRLSTAEGRKFGFTVGLAFAALGAITLWRQHAVLSQVFAAVATALILAGALVPGRLGPVYRGWMGLALLISRVTTPLFLGVVYFLVISPIGVLMRVFGKNPLAHQPENGSLWMSRPKERGTMSNQF